MSRGSVVRTVTGVLGEILISLGVFLLLFVAWQLWWTDVEANSVQSQTVTQLDREFAKGPQPLTKAGLPKNLLTGDAFAVLYIPRFGSDWARPVHEGTDHETLKRGLGHYPDSVGPGVVGNFSLAGHRTTYGRPMHDIDLLQEGDTIVVQTANSWFVYRVSSHEIVAPTELGVVAPVPNEPGVKPTKAMLTITSCHPKYSAQQRYVIHATLAKTFTRKQGLPPEYLAVPKGA